jgi:hypothetical protein
MAHCLDDTTFQPQPSCLRRQNAASDRREHCVHGFSQFRQLFQDIGWPVSRARPRLLNEAAISRIKDATRRSPVDSVAPGDQSLGVTLLTSAAACIHEVKDEVPAYVHACWYT